MNSIFNLADILKSDMIPNVLVKSNINETYLSSAISILEDMNTEINKNTFRYFNEIAEAPTKQAENQIFGEFFSKYKDTIKKYQMKMNELYSRFSINVDTLIDANSELLDDEDSIEICGNPTYCMKEFDKLDDPEFPKIKPYKVFKREFKFFGKLLQDLGPTASDEARVKIIASVYNNMVSEINKDWMQKCMEKISDNDDCKKDSFAKCIFDSIIKPCEGEKPITIDMVRQAKLSLLNNSEIKSAIGIAVDKFNEDLDKVAEEFGALLFRNKDLVLDIKTDVEGIEDRKYRLTDYSFNQVNIFMNAKLSQITEICNLYLVAISVKMDCALSYFKQCIDIIEIAKSSNCNSRNNQAIQDDTEDIDTQDNSYDDYDMDLEDPDFDGEFGDNSLSYSIQTEPEQPPVEDSEEKEVTDEMYLFEATIFEYNRAIDNIILKESLLNEAGGNASKIASSLINNILTRIEELVNKFNDVVINHNQKRIDYIKNNQASIKQATPPNGEKIQTIKPSELLNIKRQTITYPAEKDLYANDTTYFNAKFPTFKSENNKSIKDSIISKVIGPEKPFDSTDINNGITYIIGTFKQLADSTKSDLATLKAEKRKGELLTKAVGESSKILMQHNDIIRYFNEAGENNQQQSTQKSTPQNQTTKQNQQNGTQNTNNQNQNSDTTQKQQNNNEAKSAVQVYYSVNSKVLAAKMSCAQKIFNIYYNKLAALSTPPTK